MKILYLHQYFNTPEMSGGTRSYEMARRWVAAGHEVHMITSWREESECRLWFETKVAGINVHWLPVPYGNHMNYRDRIAAFLKFASSAIGRAKRVGGDIVFATSTPLTIAIPGVRVSKALGVPFVFEVRDLWPKVPIAMGALKNPIMKAMAERLELYAYGNSSHIVALSPGMKDGIVERGIRPEMISVIPNSADLSLFGDCADEGEAFRRSLNIRRDCALVTYAGTFGAVNGVSYMVRMAAAARNLDLPLHFLGVGEGRERRSVELLASELGVLGDYVTLLPPVAKKEMPKILAATDVTCSFVIDLEPLWANSANKFFDSLASGTPIAINYGGWQADLLTSNNAGLALPAEDPVEGVKMIAALVADKRKLTEMGLAARSLAEEKFDRGKLAAQLEKILINEAVAGSAGPQDPGKWKADVEKDGLIGR